MTESSPEPELAPASAPAPHPKPPLALVQLLKLLDRHPELLEEIRAA